MSTSHVVGVAAAAAAGPPLRKQRQERKYGKE